MKTEILTCDRCGKSATTEEEKEALAIGSLTVGFSIDYGYGTASHSGRVYPAHQTWRKEWCRACRTEVGCLEEEIQKAKAAAPVPTLEDMIREIVREELPQQQ